MGITRTAIVASSATNKAKRFLTSADTWSQLKREIEAQGVPVDGVDAIMEPGKVTLSSGDSLLHDGDIKIFLIATKNKAGDTISTSAAEALAGRMVTAIKKASNIADQNKMSELEDELIAKIEEFYDVDLDISVDSEEAAMLAQARKYESNR